MIEIFCLICLYSYGAKNKFKEHKNLCKNHDYCYIEMPKEENILKYILMEKSQWKFHWLFMLKKQTIPLTSEENQSYCKQKACHICKK